MSGSYASCERLRLKLEIVLFKIAGLAAVQKNLCPRHVKVLDSTTGVSDNPCDFERTSSPSSYVLRLNQQSGPQCDHKRKAVSRSPQQSGALLIDGCALVCGIGG